MVLFLLILMASAEVMGIPCQDYQITRCIETCKIKCKGLEIRPLLNEGELLRVSFHECRDQCAPYCQKGDKELKQELRGLNRSLAQFVLEDQKINNCENDERRQTSSFVIFSKIFNYFASFLTWQEKTRPYSSDGGVVPETPPPVNSSDVADASSSQEASPPVSSPPGKGAPKENLKQSLVPEYVSLNPPQNQGASTKRSSPADDSPPQEENKSRTKERRLVSQVPPPG